jgi:hypothetical protein
LTGDIFQYGQSLKLSSGFEFQGFLRPLAFESGESLAFREFGGVTGDKYLLITPPGLFDGGSAGARIFCAGADYELLRAEKKFLGETESHCECLLRQIGGDRDA